MSPLQAYKNTILEQRAKRLYQVKCDFCNELLLADSKEVQEKLYKPVNKTTEATVFAILNESTGKYEYVQKGEKITTTHKVSSDCSKDEISFKCCNCGHIVHMNRTEFEEHPVNPITGDDSLVFTMDEQETTSAKEFMKEHSETCKIHNVMQPHYQYVFTPGSIGMQVCVKCTECGETKNVTNYDIF